MDVLIICPAVLPDSIIAAVRPSMLAKYLSSFGHKVTVLRSGKVVNTSSKLEEIRPYRVISYLGSDCEAEKVERGEISCKGHSISRSTIVLQSSFQKRLSDLYYNLREPLTVYQDVKKAKKNFVLQKKILDGLKHEHFDVVFSTYSPLEDVYAGEYASKLFNCKWVMDFRDLLVQYTTRSWIRNQVFYRIQVHALKSADICTAVSEGLANSLKKCVKTANVVTLYNGYEPTKEDKTVEESNSLFTFCYTGTVYSRRGEALHVFLKAIHELVQRGVVDLNKMKFRYAGIQGDKLKQMFAEYGLETILKDYGYLASSETDKIQRSSDLFLVLSWNTKSDQGILTGKFYEGIRAKKPMLAMVVGDTPNSELALLNQEYRYGFCYEDVKGDDEFENLCGYLTAIYNEKTSKGTIEYSQLASFEEAFRYDAITKQLESIFNKIIQQ